MCDWWREPNGTYDTSDFWERGPKEIFPGLLEIDVLGGEPLIQRDTFRLIDAVSSVNPDCRWFFVTNGQYRFADKVKSYFDKIALRTIALSVDSLRPEVFSEIRRRGSLEKALKTLDDLIEYRESRNGDFTIELIFTVMRDNWREAADVIGFAASKGIGVTFNFVFEPHALSLLSLDEAPRMMILDYYDECLRSSANPTLNAVIAPLRASVN